MSDILLSREERKCLLFVAGKSVNIEHAYADVFIYIISDESDAPMFHFSPFWFPHLKFAHT
jgi:hypothetical protein